jgi:adenylate cyclase
MQNVQRPNESGEAIPSGHSSEPRALVRFSGFVLDLDACRLERENGETVALTRGEYSLLRFLVSRRGRVVSRETLLNEVSNRRFDPFDRSVDAAVRRLRRKIEANPSRPRLIVTVAGEGYRFDGRTAPLAGLSKVEGQPFPAPDKVVAMVSALAQDSQRTCPEQPNSSRRLYFLAAAIVFALLAGAWPFLWAPGVGFGAPPIVAVMPFDNLTGDSGRDYLGRSISLEVATLLSAYPGLKVVPPPNLSSSTSAAESLSLAQSAGARYVIKGGIHLRRDSLRITTTLSDIGTRAVIWSQIFDGGDGALGSQEDVPRQIYDSLAGFRGAVQRSEEGIAWRKPSSSLSDYDYYLRGASLYFRSDVSDVLKARSVFQEGLDRFPDSALLRQMLAWTHLWVAMNEMSKDPGPDIDKAWRLATETSSSPSYSPFEAWLQHWLMAFLFQWRDNDFSRSVTEARNAVELAPYDAFSRSDLSWIMANAGHAEEAIEWARFALQHDPSGPSRYHANLAWAYYVAGRERDGINALLEKSSEFPILSAALHVRLGEVEEAQTLIAEYIRAGGQDTVHREDIVPLIEPTGAEYVEALRKTGMPEK